MSETVHVDCFLYHVLLNLTSKLVLDIDWLHGINYLIYWNTYLLSLDHGGKTVCILSTKKGYSAASIKDYTLELVLKMMSSNRVSA